MQKRSVGIAALCIAMMLSTTSTATEKNNVFIVHTPAVCTKEHVVAPYFNVTSVERELIARVVYQEGNIESFDCQAAIASVVVNRVGAYGFADTINGVVYQEGQFDVSGLLKKTTPTEQNYQAVDYVIKNGPTVPTWVKFFRTRKHFSWNGYVGYTKIDHTYFGGIK